MLWLYFSAALGFYIFAALSSWHSTSGMPKRAQLRSFLREWKLYTFYAFIFGWFGPFFNLDTAIQLLNLDVLPALIKLPDVFPMSRSFVLGLAGPVVAARLFMSGTTATNAGIELPRRRQPTSSTRKAKKTKKTKSRRSHSIQIDDITSTQDLEKTESFGEKSRRLFGIPEK